MAYSQRQKKKNSQSRKRHYNQQKQRQSLESSQKTTEIGGQLHHNTSSDTITVDHHAGPQSDRSRLYDSGPSTDLSVQAMVNVNTTQVGRQVEIDGNTSQLSSDILAYDSEDIEQDRLIEERLSQLLSVRQSSIGTTNTTSAAVLLPEEHSTDHEESSNILSIDLHQLAKSLTGLPLCERLLIDQELVDLCERGGQRQRNGQLESDRRQTVRERENHREVDHSHLTSIKDLTTSLTVPCRQDNLTTMFKSLDVLQQHVLQHATKETLVGRGRNDREPSTRETIVARGKNNGIPSTRDTIAGGRDDGNTKLLTELLEQDIILEESREVKKSQLVENKLSSNVPSLSEPRRATNEHSSTTHTTTSQLDNALDELLDM